MAARANEIAVPILSEPLTVAPRAPGPPLLTRIDPDASGLTAENPFDDPAMWGRRYAEFSGGPVGTGVAAGDFDRDGLPDLYVVNKTAPNRLYRQVAPFVFSDVTEAAGVAGGSAWGTGATFVDVDGDGWLDLFVCQLNAPNLLYHNNRDGTFTDRARAAGLDIVTGSVSGAFADYDRDGDLDLFLVTNLGDTARAPEGDPDILYRNNGDGTFIDVTAAAGLVRAPDRGHSATWFDADGDGWPDLHVANDFDAPDHLYRNNRDGTFTDIAASALPHLPWYAMGADFGDINNDGRPDLFVADMAGTTHLKRQTFSLAQGNAAAQMEREQPPQYAINALYLNTGDARFLEIAQLAGVARTDWTWSVLFADFDNDGWLDLHVTNGMVRDFANTDLIARLRRAETPAQAVAVVRRSQVLAEDNLALRNTGNLEFENATSAWGLSDTGVSFGAVAVDLDRDGDLDLVHTNFERPVSLFRNDSDSRRVSIVLRGRGANPFAVGARLVATTSTGRQERQITLSRGALSSTPAEVHFGLGTDEAVARLEIHWPVGSVQSAEHLAGNFRYTFQQPGEASAAHGAAGTENGGPLFRDVTDATGLRFANRERSFDEFAAQPLLPRRLSRLGGGLACADVDGDGDPDLYFAGASGQPGELWLNHGDGRFALDPRPQPWTANADAEEIAVLWFDANGDGAPDLLITSGGVEHAEGDPALADCLYLNDGHGGFRRAPDDVFPARFTPSSCAVAADFDGDGDLDLFIGGAVFAGRYPFSAGSRLLENRDGVFQEVAPEVFPGLVELGRVSAAIWSDVNGDGWPDLLVAAEWEPIRIFLNRGGRAFDDATAAAGLAPQVGWWRSIAADDVDGDGDMDYIVGNVGLNTPYRASREHPVHLFVGDFDESGTMQLLEAYEDEVDSRLLPRRNLATIARAIPAVRGPYRTAADFARATLDEIAPLEDAHQLSATQLAHGILLNDGNGRFTFHELPRLAQAAPVNDIAARDFDGDGNIDLLLVQNDHGPQPEIPRFGGGRGLFLRGRGDGTFEPMMPEQSGVDLPGPCRAIAVLDWNRDGFPDVVVTRSDDAAIALENQSSAEADSRHSSCASKVVRATPARLAPCLPLGIATARVDVRSCTPEAGIFRKTDRRHTSGRTATTLSNPSMSGGPMGRSKASVRRFVRALTFGSRSGLRCDDVYRRFTCDRRACGAVV